MKKIALCLILTGCTTFNLSPKVPFRDVQREVCERTGETIFWENESCLDPVFPLTMTEAIRICLYNSPRVKGTFASLGIAQADLAQSGLLKNPIFSMSLKYENFQGPGTIFNLGLVEEIVDLLLKSQKVKLSKIELEKRKVEVTQTVLQILGEVKKGYITLFFEEHLLEKIQTLYEAKSASVLAAERLFEAGNLTKLELSIKQALEKQFLAAFIEQKIKVNQAKQDLFVLLGFCDEPQGFILEKTILLPPNYDMEDLSTQAVCASLELAQARQELSICALQFGISRIETTFPEVWAGVDSERDSDVWFAGPNLITPIPIFDLGLAQKAKAKATLQTLCNDYLAKEIMIRAEARKLCQKIAALKEEHQIYQTELVPKLKEVTEQTQLQYNGMQLGLFALLEAKEKELEGEMKGFETWKSYWFAAIDLELFVGGLTP
jgi:cobalt-zinc-cadmium efflux system outer membrane protein